MQSLKAVCIQWGIPLMVRYRYLRPHEIVAGTHTLYFDPERFTAVRDDGVVLKVAGVGFGEEEAFADLVVSLKAAMRARGSRPACDVLLVGRSVYDNEICDEIRLTEDLTV